MRKELVREMRFKELLDLHFLVSWELFWRYILPCLIPVLILAAVVLYTRRKDHGR